MIKSGNYSKNILFDYETSNKNIFTPYTIAPKFIIFKTIPFEVLTKFFEEVKLDNDKIFSMYQFKFYYNKELKNNNDKFVYGIDEYFLNINYVNYFIDNKLPFGVNIKWEINGNLFNTIKKINLINKNNT